MTGVFKTAKQGVTGTLNLSTVFDTNKNTFKMNFSGGGESDLSDGRAHFKY